MPMQRGPGAGRGSHATHDGSTPASSSALDGVVAAAVALAPEAVKRRELLQSVDWSRVAPPRVAAMLCELQAGGRRIPHWLARSLVLGGHVLPDSVAQALPLELRLLNDLAGADAATQPSDIETLRQHERRDADALRALVARLAGGGKVAEACAIALSHWHDAPQVLQPLRQCLDTYVAGLPVLRLHVAAFSTADTLAKDLRSAAAAAGFQAEVGLASFGEVVATLLAPRDDVDAHIVMLDAMPLIERDWRMKAAESEAAIRSWADMLAGAIGQYVTRTTVPILLNTLAAPAFPTAGWRDSDHALGLHRAIGIVNDALVALARAHASLHLVDSDAALADIAPAQRSDAKLWYYGRVAWSAEAGRALARAFAQALRAARHGPAKVLALDFDNTLWGGVYGDDGIERLQCGEEAPGNAFQAFQRECLRLKGQGFILVGLSKNNADAIDVFDKHPGMLLKREDFAATAIDWEPKAGNIARLAGELRLGPDSFLFLDDSPHEREAMRRLMPQVIVPEMPADPALRPEWLRRLVATWPSRLTAEDMARSSLYAAEAAARSLKATAATLGDYLRGLEQRLEVRPVTRETIGRAAQMHQRTNQFNLTTRRCTESDIAALTADPARGLALLGRVSDKFGDHGITVAATATIDGDTAEISTFLMSCRVIGREIERAFLGALLGELGSRGVDRVRGSYIATAKNTMARDFYTSNGFRRVADSAEGALFEFRLGVDAAPASGNVKISQET